MTALALAAALATLLLSAEAPTPTAPPAAKGAAKPTAAARPRHVPGKPYAPAPDAAPAAPRDPAADDRLLAEQKCSKCHDLSRALSSALSDAEWKAHLKRMGSAGTPVNDEQRRRIQSALRALAAEGSGRPAPATASR